MMLTIFIIGKGNSFNRAFVSKELKEKFVIAINDEFTRYEKVGWINAIFFKDYRFIVNNRDNEKWKNFKGLKLTSCTAQWRKSKAGEFYGMHCFGKGKRVGIDKTRGKVVS